MNIWIHSINEKERKGFSSRYFYHRFVYFLSHMGRACPAGALVNRAARVLAAFVLTPSLLGQTPAQLDLCALMHGNLVAVANVCALRHKMHFFRTVSSDNATMQR